MRHVVSYVYAICGSFTLFLATGIMTIAFAQNKPLTFTDYTINEGLSDGLVNCVRQDHQGFMWFGTGDGLDRFDGYEFTVYHHNPFDSTSISDNSITALFTDSRGQLWIGTLKGGLNLYDRDHNRFLHFFPDKKHPGNRGDNYIKCITEDKQGDLWLASSNNGLFEFVFAAKKNGTFQLPERIIHYIHLAGDKNGLDYNFINAIFIDHENRLWASTGNHSLQVADLNRPGLRFATPSFTVLQPKVTILKSGVQYDGKQIENAGGRLNTYQVLSFYEDDHQHLWIGAVGVFFVLKNNSDTVISYPVPLLPGLKNPSIYSMIQGPAGNSHSLWLSNWNGIFIFNERDLQLRFVKNQPGNKEGLLGGVILNLYKDSSGCIWLGTNGYGVSKYDPHSSLFSSPVYYSSDKDTQTDDFSVLAFLETKDYLLLGTYDGLYRINKKNYLINRFERPYIISNMMASDTDKVWMADIGGLALLNLHNRQIAYYSPGIFEDGQEDARIIKIYNDHQGGLWLLTTHSFSYFNIATKKFTNYSYRRGSLNTLYYPFHGDIYRDGHGNFWLGSEIGLLYFNTQHKTFQYYANNPKDTSSLSFNVVECVVPDPKRPDEYLWIGTAGGGLNKFNLLTKRFTHLTIEDGLPNNTIDGILADNKGYLWISTNNGLSRFNPSTHTFHNYDIHEGLSSNEFNPGAYYKNPQGEFFFGNVKGFNAFYPDSIQNSSFIPPLVFTDFRLFNKPVSAGEKNSPLKQAISETHVITLPYNENMISFQVAALDYSESYKNKYAYRLIGLNKRWIHLGNDRQITFGNLTPGHYILQVKASNSDGVWNEKGISMNIHILPPWWKTGWAYVIYALIAVVLIWIVRKGELNRIKLKNNLALESFEAAKLKELDGIKSRFFANISHEFRTPLTLVLGPLNDFSKDGNINRLKDFIPEMQRNAKRLLQLINQLLDIARLDSNHYPVNTSSEDIIPFVKQIVHSFSSLAHRKNIELDTEVDPRLREKLVNEENHFYFDADIIEKILTNLLSNAFKFTPDGGSIIVNLHLPERERNYLVLEVEDNGTGIPEEKLHHIFDRFYQADDSNIRQHEGSGIGLALVKELTELHQGKISAASHPGKGTVISCYLPFDKKIKTSSSKITYVKISENAITETELEDTDGMVEKKETGDLPVILIVEDQRDVRKYIREKIENSYKVIEARDGKEGLEKALENVPDLVISDVMMPAMDGFELCKKLKTDDRTCHIPIILLTARAEDHDKMTGLETGADAYLVKPFNAQELLVRVSKLIEVRKRMRKKFSGKLIIKPSEITVTNRDREFMQKLTSLAESHLSDPEFSNEQLCREMNMSISQLRRKLKAVIDQSPQQMIRSLRMQRALELLKKEAGTVSEISWQTGFEDPGYFSKVFKSYFGCLPTEREKFPRE